MRPHTRLSLLWVADATMPAPSSLAAYLESIPHVQLGRGSVAATTLEVIDGD